MTQTRKLSLFLTHELSFPLLSFTNSLPAPLQSAILFIAERDLIMGIIEYDEEIWISTDGLIYLK